MPLSPSIKQTAQLSAHSKDHIMRHIATALALALLTAFSIGCGLTDEEEEAVVIEEPTTSPYEGFWRGEFKIEYSDSDGLMATSRSDGYLDVYYNPETKNIIFRNPLEENLCLVVGQVKQDGEVELPEQECEEDFLDVRITYTSSGEMKLEDNGDTLVIELDLTEEWVDDTGTDTDRYIIEAELDRI